MSILQRQHIRFSLDIPAVRYTKFGERVETVLQQISIGGCLAEWDENIFTGEEFRLEIQLPNRNWLPLMCKALYRFENNGIGARFLEISKFEQELIARIISNSLAIEGLPLQVDPFSQPPSFNEKREVQIRDSRRRKEAILEEVMSSEEA